MIIPTYRAIGKNDVFVIYLLQLNKACGMILDSHVKQSVKFEDIHKVVRKMFFLPQYVL